MKYFICLLSIFLITGCGNGGSSSNSNLKATISVNNPTVSPGNTTNIVVTNSSNNVLINPFVRLDPWLTQIASNKNLEYPGLLLKGESYTFSFTLDNSESTAALIRTYYQLLLNNSTNGIIQANALNAHSAVNPTLTVNVAPDPLYLPLTEDILINADLWSDIPEIMSAGYAFEGIQGVPQGENYVIAAGGAWETVTTPNPPYRALTSAAAPSGISVGFGYPTYYADALPVVFSWPVLPSTVLPTDFSITLNTGEVVTPYVASINPNLEFNERSVVVLFGSFGNRLTPGTNGAIYPINVTVVKNLQLVGPNGPVSAVGLTKASTNAYESNSGPQLLAAKLSVMNIMGEGVGCCNAFSSGYPNNGVSYYGESNAQYRLRLYTSGGFSPDGVAAVLPTDFATFFRIQVTSSNGTVSWITQAGVPYSFPEGTIQVVGLADLGLAGSTLNDAYIEDFDNYIDIVLKGDVAAMRRITAVEIPASGGYKPFYNPGGPGNNPTPGVIYTSPGPYKLQPVTMAIDNPLTVSYGN
ncbi:MAG: phospholipase [Burkholderiales bacterium]|jgi:hypothetical protein|nr:phospholipase [Burkholderiales bacterium]